MPLEPGLLAYSALASFALAHKKHRPHPPFQLKGSTSTEKGKGIILLLISAMAAMLRFGPAMGAVAWVGQICLAGAILVLFLSYNPHQALKMRIPALTGAAVMLIASGL